MEGKSYFCPSCTAAINIDPNRGFTFCPYCGTKVFLNENVTTPNININVNTAATINRSSEMDNFIIRALQFERNGQFDEAEYYFNRALDIDITSRAAKEGLKRVQTHITRDNLFLQRGNACTNGEARVNAFIDGKKYGHIDPNSTTSFKLPVGTHYLKLRRVALDSETITLNIENNKVYYEISAQTKTFRIILNTKRYLRREILH